MTRGYLSICPGARELYLSWPRRAIHMFVIYLPGTSNKKKGSWLIPYPRRMYTIMTRLPSCTGAPNALLSVTRSECELFRYASSLCRTPLVTPYGTIIHHNRRYLHEFVTVTNCFCRARSGSSVALSIWKHWGFSVIRSRETETETCLLFHGNKKIFFACTPWAVCVP